MPLTAWIVGEDARAGRASIDNMLAVRPLAQRLHVAAERDLRRQSVVGDHHVVLVAVEQPFAADQRRLGDLFAANGGTVGANATWPTMVSSLVARSPSPALRHRSGRRSA